MPDKQNKKTKNNFSWWTIWEKKEDWKYKRKVSNEREIKTGLIKKEGE